MIGLLRVPAGIVETAERIEATLCRIRRRCRLLGRDPEPLIEAAAAGSTSTCSSPFETLSELDQELAELAAALGPDPRIPRPTTAYDRQAPFGDGAPCRYHEIEGRETVRAGDPYRDVARVPELEDWDPPALL